MSKHTPGPWLLLGTKQVSFPMRAKDCTQGTWYFTAQVGGGSFHYDEVAEAELVANAKLVAAAPEMLEALRYIHSVIHHFGPDAKVYELKAMLDARIEQTIEKAEGRR